ncbi:MAG: cytochrome c oxidase cbb3-type subunit 3 [Planctomycetota bacterium]|jgi:cytochrome c oxidase cbb3-type subunit 3
MSDFNSEFWSWFIIVPTVLGIAACFWLIWWMSTSGKSAQSDSNDTGHVWDGDLTELNNPLPRWWLGLFYITLFFSIGYLILYPGLGSFPGYLGWSSTQEYESEMDAADAEFGALYKKFLAQDLQTVAQNDQALKMGQRLFVNHCATCHGSDARGARGFPNLRDQDWLWGGSAEAIKLSIMDGRIAMMPAWELPLGGEAGVADMTDYVLSLSGREHDSAAALRGKAKFDLFCFACHGADGKGNTALGSANLTDSHWLYGGSRLKIGESIAKGRQGHMPAHRDFLGEAKVQLIAAYVYRLSQQP